MNSQTSMVIFQPSGRRGQVPTGVSLVEASRMIGVDVEAPCGGKLGCGKCKIRIEQGAFKKYGIESKLSHAGPWHPEEAQFVSPQERAAGYRMGCAATVEGDLLIYVPEAARAGKQVVSKAARPIDVEIDPAVRQYRVALTPPTLEDPTGNFERLSAALEAQAGLKWIRMDLVTLRRLQAVLENGGWQATVAVWMDREIIHVQPGPHSGSYGLAIDIGTTTVAVYLCDLVSGQVIDTLSMMNPQVKYGEDVVSRISYHMEHPDGLERMGADLIAGLNRLIDQILSKEYFSPFPENGDVSGENRKVRILADDILDVTIAGNTAMHHST